MALIADNSTPDGISTALHLTSIPPQTYHKKSKAPRKKPPENHRRHAWGYQARGYYSPRYADTVIHPEIE